MSLRVPVPWGKEPKAQVVSGFNNTQRWYQDNDDRPSLRDLDELFGEVEFVEAAYKAPPIAIERGKSLSQELPELPATLAFAKALQKAAAPRRARSQVTALPPAELSALELPAPTLLAWASQRGIKLNPRPEIFVPLDPFATRSKVRSIDIDKQQWADILPPSLLQWAVAKGVDRLPVETLEPQDPFATRTKVIARDPRRQVAVADKRAEWHKIPPALAKWAVERGIKKAEPPPRPRAQVYTIEKRQQIFTALQRGDWCLVYELDEFLPPRLRRWLIECKVTLIRYVGGGAVGGIAVNGYVTEDGLVFYCAEDGQTIYVQET